jgi:hypothetical protein
VEVLEKPLHEALHASHEPIQGRNLKRWRYERTHCKQCGERLTGRIDANFCGDACRNKHWRYWRRQNSWDIATNLCKHCGDPLGERRYNKHYCSSRCVSPPSAPDPLRRRAPWRQMTASVRERASWHEAGHCAAAITYGAPIISVSIDSDKPHMHRAHYRAPPDLGTEAMSILALAGPASEEYFCGPIDDGSDQTDIAMTRQYLSRRYDA